MKNKSNKISDNKKITPDDQWLDEQDHFLLKRILKYEMATQDQIQKGLSLYYQDKMAKKPIRLAGVLVQNGIITQNELELFDTFQDMNKVTEMDRSFAALALKNKLVELDNIKIAFQKQTEHFKKTKKIILIGDILTKQGMMTTAYRDAILSRQKRIDVKYQDSSFGAVAIKMGLATRDQIDDALATQQKIFSMTNKLQLLGNILVDKNVLTNAQTRQILIHQKDLKNLAEQREQERISSRKTKKKNKEKNGKTRFVDVQDYINIIVTKDHLEARILPIKNLPEDTNLDDILFVLSEKNIKYGVVNHYHIRTYLKNPLLQKSPWLIAHGKKPTPPEHPSIIYGFKSMLDNISLRSKKSIEHLAFEKWPKAKKGDILAKRVPGISGVPGISVYAEIIDIDIPKEVQLISGFGTQLSEDGNQLIASREGLISSYMRNKICVLPEKYIEGDLVQNKEPFRFKGVLRVSGVIKGKHPIKSTIIFAGGIENTQIHSETDIIVFGDILNARINAKGHVVARNILNSKIDAFGHVVAKNDIDSSSVISSGQVSVIDGNVKNTKIDAYQGIFAFSISSESDDICTLSVGQDILINDRVTSIDKQLPTLKQNLEKLGGYINEIEKNFNQINDSIHKLKKYIGSWENKKKELSAKEDIKPEILKKYFVQIDEKISAANDKMKIKKQQVQKNKERYLRYHKSYQQHFKQVKIFNEERLTLKEWLKNGYDQPGIMISESIKKGTQIVFPNSNMPLDKDHSHISIKEIKNPDETFQLRIEALTDSPN
ncbi:protein containing DUF342 [Candidatus Magnetomorum sp. HK-1]|nr:protein containing DUF342 [Candidatus Magnetomorum sp. HK-1]